MDLYKSVLRSKALRFRILSALRFVPDEPMLRLQYRIKCGRKLNLDDPRRYTEKIQWYKLNYRDPKMRRCADKYQVREYVKSKGLGHLLNEVYAVFETPEDICFDDLPDKFVLKVSNGSSTNLLCRDKSKLDPAAVKRQFKEFLIQSNSNAGCEWVYNDGKPVIIAERFLEDPSQPDGALCDYKILCFGGEPKYVVYDVDRFTAHKRNIYDTKWNDRHIATDCPCIDGACEKPAQLEQMLEIARILSADFPAARVDLYLLGGDVRFGELTFFPWSGYVNFQPDSFDYEMGDQFVLPAPQQGNLEEGL